MKNILNTFLPLYTTTLLMLLGSGLLTTYISLRLAHEDVSGTVIGAITAANYLGLVIGGKVGHNLIARVGHIRAYVSCAGIITASVVGHGLSDFIPLWIFLRMVIGLCMMCQYMVLESWLNDRAESSQRGAIFGLYMVATYLGLCGGQIILMAAAGTGPSMLLIVALCFALCLVPIALTTRTTAQPMTPAPMELGYFFKAIPKLLAATLVMGMAAGAFYGLAPVYAISQGLTTQQTGLFMGVTIFAGMVSQFPLSWLSDRYDRQHLLFYTAVLFALASLPLSILPHLGFYWLLGIAFVSSMAMFSLYPLGVAIANDHVEAERRVSLTACLLMAFGVGACIGPLITGAVMQPFGGNVLYFCFTLCGVTIGAISWIRKRQPEIIVDAPLPHVVMPDSLMSSPLAVALNPSMDEEVIQEAMVDTPPEDAAPEEKITPDAETSEETAETRTAP
ncbi:cyanate permease [Scandinavium goeteborgense]|uniref:Cyanate permease n=2 Tax=Scandinavium goeteborgense TaxID=1851514 RepID=A0A4R6ENG3_SCAGO|nr:MFS transporter [Scandinavium goeteborgense]TDN60747.1 cyanate permease [Scandinavium goeteborgense]